MCKIWYPLSVNIYFLYTSVLLFFNRTPLSFRHSPKISLLCGVDLTWFFYPVATFCFGVSTSGIGWKLTIFLVASGAVEAKLASSVDTSTTWRQKFYEISFYFIMSRSNLVNVLHETILSTFQLQIFCQEKSCYSRLEWSIETHFFSMIINKYCCSTIF